MGNELITRDQLQTDLEFYHNNKVLPYLNGAAHTGFTPIGTIIDLLGTIAPEHYLKCDGHIYNITDYNDLANYFETTYGSKNYFGGDGITTFAVPTIAGDGDIIKCICAINNYIDWALDGFPVNISNPENKQVLAYDSTQHKWTNIANEIEILEDVDITSAANGQSLIYDATQHKWVNDTNEIESLKDVAITTPIGGQNLIYDATQQKWVNGTDEIGTLEDVEITNPIEGQNLIYNATQQKWVNGINEIDTLENVNITNPTDGQGLIYNAATQKWINNNIGSGRVTVLTQTLSAGNNFVTFTGLPTTGNYLIDFFTSKGINYDSIITDSSPGEVTLSFETQSTDVTVYCRIEEVV